MNCWVFVSCLVVSIAICRGNLFPLPNSFVHSIPDEKLGYPIPKLNLNRSAIDDYIRSIFDCKSDQIGAINLAVAQLDENDQILQSMATGYGKTNLTDPSSPMTDQNSRFCVGSTSKQFTGQMIGKILEMKNLTFDVKLKDLLPDSYQFYSLYSPYLAEKLTLRDLLSHRTAIPRHDNTWALGMRKNREEVWRNLYHLSPVYGDLSSSWRSSFEYNNWMVSLASYAATLLYDPSGKTSWENLIKEFFFKPLQMDSAVFLHDNHEWKNFSIPANRYESDSQWTPMNLDYVQKAIVHVAPAGAICLSAVDMVKYIQHLTRTSESPGEAPRRKTLYEGFLASNYMRSAFNLKDPTFTQTEDVYGFGWASGSFQGVRIITHDGGIFGYLSNLVVLPDYKAAVYMSSTNDPWYSTNYVAPLSLGVVEILMGNSVSRQLFSDSLCPIKMPPLTSNLTDSFNCTVEYHANVQKVVGVYSNPTFDDIIVDYLPSTHQLRFYFATQGTGNLCAKGGIDSVETGIVFLKIDANSSVAISNKDQLAGAEGNYIVFNETADGMTLIPYFFEPRANTPPIYTKIKSVISTTTTETIATPTAASTIISETSPLPTTTSTSTITQISTTTTTSTKPIETSSNPTVTSQSVPTTTTTVFAKSTESIAVSTVSVSSSKPTEIPPSVTSTSSIPTTSNVTESQTNSTSTQPTVPSIPSTTSKGSSLFDASLLNYVVLFYFCFSFLVNGCV